MVRIMKPTTVTVLCWNENQKVIDDERIQGSQILDELSTLGTTLGLASDDVHVRLRQNQGGFTSSNHAGS